MSSNYICKDDFDNYLIICETQPAEKGQPSFAKGHNPERLLPEKLVQHQEFLDWTLPFGPELHIVKMNPHQRTYSGGSTHKKLLFLTLVASLALLCIVVLSEQLIRRHTMNDLRYPEQEGGLVPDSGPRRQLEQLDILTLEEWTDPNGNDLFKVQFSYNEDVVLDQPNPDSKELLHDDGRVIVEDGIFWSAEMEAIVSPGPSDQEVQSKLQRLRESVIVSVENPDWLHCGREKNRFVHFNDGGSACARYRPAHPEFVQGEVMAFYLARILGITNSPVVTLSKTNTNQWEGLDSSQNATDWPSESIVALIEWVPNLTKTTMPLALRQVLTSGTHDHPINVNSIRDISNQDDNVLSLLVQWSDLIIFDYLTGNYDRVASMQDGAEKEKRPSILRETIHNLALSRDTESLWLIDNESSFLDAYALLYREDENGNRFIRFHETLLRSMCIFRKRTVRRLQFLTLADDPADLLLKFITDNEPLFNDLPRIFSNSIYSQHFPERLKQVWQWVKECQTKS